MRRAIDPESIKIDTSDLAKLDMVDTANANTFINTKYSTGKKVEIRVESTTQGLLISPTGVIRLGSATTLSGANSSQHYLEIGEGNIVRYRYGTYNNYYLPYKDNEVGKTYTYTILTNQNVKTLFGNQSICGTGNIDLYEHDITITKGTGKAFLTIYSSKNTTIDSLTDLKTLAGDTFTKSCTGYINGKVIVAITETSFLLADGTTELLTDTTFVDTTTTI